MDEIPLKLMKRNQKLTRYVNQLPLLNKKVTSELTTAVTDTLLARESGQDWRRVLRKYKSKYKIGVAGRLFEELYQLSNEEMELLSEALTRGIDA